MITKDVYQLYNTDAVLHFGIDCDSFGIMVSTTNEAIETVYADNSAYIYKKITEILSDCSDETSAPDLTKLKKAFIFPNADLSQDRIKMALKEHKIIITNNYEEADLYLTHNNIVKTFKNGETINTRTLLPQLWNYDAITGGNINIHNYIIEQTNLNINNKDIKVIEDSKLLNCINRYAADYVSYSMDVDTWLLTSMAVNCAYRVEQGQAEVWNIEKIMNQSATKVELTEQLIKDLITLNNSSNQEDRNMICAILPTIKYKTNYHLLWQLSQDIGSSMNYYYRNKDVKFWENVSEINKYYRMDALEMIQYLEEKEKLNLINFKYLEPIVRKQISIDNRELYTFKVELKPEYKKYLKNG